MSENPLETFREECNELLDEMESALLALEEQPADEEHINSVFRAAHTIKGTAGIFGFDEVQSFTHRVENILEQVRSGTVVLNDNLIALLLASKDHIAVLVGFALDDAPLDTDTSDRGNTLIAALGDYLASEGPFPGTEQAGFGNPLEERAAAVEADESRVVADSWHLSVRFGADVLRAGMDPLAFLRYLNRLGDILHVTPIVGDMRSLADMDPESCHTGVEVEFSSDAEKAEIVQVFEFVADDCVLHVLPPRAHIARYAELIEALPEDDLRLGEILVRSKALTEYELKQILGRQDELRRQAAEHGGPEPECRIGDLLVQEEVVHREVVDAALAKQDATRHAKPSARQWLRVDAEKLDQLITQVGELVIASATSNLIARQTGHEHLLEAMSVTGRLVEEIRDNALNLRMVQVGETFKRFQRVVRDVSRDLNKAVRLEITGGETELDKTVVEKIGDPLMHLVRNAMDHGLEAAEERLAAGKPAEGRLKLHAYHDSGSIVMEVSDDGRGLDRDAILGKARERGLVGEETALSEREIHQLIFEPGFSTAEAVSNLSGRGVGMDVVRRNIEALRGTVDVYTEPGHGTKFVIRLPLTLAIIDGFLVRVGGAFYVIPLDMVLECVELSGGNAEQRSRSYMNLRGDALPFLRLRNQFAVDGPAPDRENIVVVRYGTQQAGLVVDELLGEFQTVIKPLGKVFQYLRGVSGSTILGSGEVAVILDVPVLVGLAVEQGASESAFDRAPRTEETAPV